MQENSELWDKVREEITKVIENYCCVTGSYTQPHIPQAYNQYVIDDLVAMLQRVFEKEGLG